MSGVNAGDAVAPMNCGPIVNAPVFDIRNGDETTATNVYVRPTIPAAYHWMPIHGLPPSQALNHVGAYVRSAKAQLDSSLATTVPEAQRVKQAIVLGVGRAVMTRYYGIEAGDLIAGETVNPIYGATQSTTTPGTYVVALRAGMPQAMMDSAQLMPDMSDVERQAAAALHISMIGALPLQGYSLMMTQHHYLSSHGSPSRKAFDVVERQFWRAADVATWFQDDLDMVRDVAWHKTGHPVSMSLKNRVSRDPRVANMLKTAGAGSAAARLPAVEPEVRAAGSFRTLCATVRPLMATYGGSLDFTVLEEAMAAVEMFPYEVRVVNVQLPPSVPPSVTSRTTAMMYLNQVMSRNSDLVAYCYGFYVALSEQSMLSGAATATDTLKSSYSLAKLKTQSYASYVAGNQAFGDYDASRRAARNAGQFSPPSLAFF